MSLGGSVAEWQVDRALDVRKMPQVEALRLGDGQNGTSEARG